MRAALQDLESLISDSNRSIATLAITTLLKTGSEFSVDRLMKQISSFMADIADEFKIVVVDAIRSLCLKCAPAMRGRAKSAWVGMRTPPLPAVVGTLKSTGC